MSAPARLTAGHQRLRQTPIYASIATALTPPLIANSADSRTAILVYGLEDDR